MDGVELLAQDRAAARLAVDVAGFALKVPAGQILDRRRGTAEVAFRAASRCLPLSRWLRIEPRARGGGVRTRPFDDRACMSRNRRSP